MIKCNLCGMEKKDGRQMHGHFMKSHYQEYKAAGLDLEKVTTGYIRKIKEETETGPPVKNTRPESLRLLNKNDPHELEAYELSYRYFDPENSIAYTSEEIKEKGWL